MLQDELHKLSAGAQSELAALKVRVTKAEGQVLGVLKSHVAYLIVFAAGVLAGALAHML